MVINNYKNNGLFIYRFTPLKISIRIADEISTKLPVTYLEQAPRRGAVSNLHWYQCVLLHLFNYSNLYI